ncbi:MAG: hypothetical protein UV51_C0015G0004 [Candidatus Woesebacteria bacterium GW2011_GWC1_42_9]|nr:MAG: hypothetical protein UV51_C0015G0004 [Candidatus Woesebacteria bacterium GW2011_GWC1_42_9]
MNPDISQLTTAEIEQRLGKLEFNKLKTVNMLTEILFEITKCIYELQKRQKTTTFNFFNN